MSVGNSGRDLVVYLSLLPLLEWLMTSPRIAGKPPNVQRSVTVAATVLIAFSAIKIGYELTAKEPSFYDQLDVVPGVGSRELKSGYKRSSLKVHPDKLQESNEEVDDEAFVALKAAYDVLSDVQLRDLYDKFGPAGLEHKNDTTQLLAGVGFFYVVWLALAYLLTRRKTVSRAQTWTFTGLLALAIFEYQACILNFDFLQDQLPGLVMFEKIELLHRLYPVYLCVNRPSQPPEPAARLLP